MSAAETAWWVWNAVWTLIPLGLLAYEHRSDPA